MVAVYILLLVVVVDYHGINFFEPLKERGDSEIIVRDEPLCIFEPPCCRREVAFSNDTFF